VDVDPGAPSGTALPPATAGSGTWWRILLGVALVAALVLVYARAHDSRRLLDTKVLATCTTDRDAAPPPITADLDTSVCTGTPQVRADSRGTGWSVVAFVLPAGYGLDPEVRGVDVDRDARTVSLDVDAVPDESRRDAADASTSTLVLVEVETSKLPDLPFTVNGTDGPVTVTSLPS
jgi:hypothetical protein